MTTTTKTKTRQTEKSFTVGSERYTGTAYALVGTYFYGYGARYVTGYATVEEADAYESYRAAQGHTTVRYMPDGE